MNSNFSFGNLKTKTSLREDAQQLAIVLHGYGANAADLFPLHQVIQFKTPTDWVFPEGILDLEYFESRAWFPIDMMALQEAMNHGTHRNFDDIRPAGFDNALVALKQAIAGLEKSYDRIILGGFSQGAMMASHLSMELEQVEFCIFFSANLIDRNRFSELAKARKKPLPFFQSHGLYDPVLSFQSAKSLFEILQSNRHIGKFVEFPGAHEIPPVCIQELNQMTAQI